MSEEDARSGAGTSERGLGARARRALAEVYRALHPDVPLDPDGYVPRFEDNLLPGVPVEIVRAALADAAGQELEGKIRAVHSSAALVANSFGPWLRDPEHLELAEMRGFETLELEFKARIFASPHATPAHLDLLARGPEGIAAVESKLTEHLKPPTPRFSPAYDRFLPATDPRAAWIPILRADRTSARLRATAGKRIALHVTRFPRTKNPRRENA